MKNLRYKSGTTCLYFKKWSRKRYAIFSSLNKVVKICTLISTYTILNKANTVAAQTDTVFINNKVDLEEVEIIGQRSPGVYNDVARMITVISREEIESAPVQNLNEIIKYAVNVDIRQRGVFGVQSDVAIRGGTFDHSLILLNGINISDPQTGHFNLDVPVDIESIERIEILNGPGARVYGSNAFTGAINIITKKGDKKNLVLSASGGENGFLKSGFTVGMPVKNLSNQLSYSFTRSDGYAPATDFLIHSFFYNGNLKKNNNLFEVQAGISKKEFGANAFYSPRFPNQFEEGSVLFGSFKLTSGTNLLFKPHFYWRRKADHFILEKSDPSFYQNFHITNIFGSQFSWSFDSKSGRSNFGFDLRSENIISTNLGYDSPKPIRVKGEDSIFYAHDYTRSNIGLFWERNFSYGNFQFSGGALINWNNEEPLKAGFFPGVDISYKIFKTAKIFGSYNRSVHQPTFTDLFYTDPTNQGNLNLKSNILSSYEAGLKFNKYFVDFQAAWFFNSGKDIIDWLWSPEKRVYSPVNLNKFTTKGVEISVKTNLYKLFDFIPVENIEINYAYTDVIKSADDTLSKYYNLRNKLNMGVTHILYKNLKATWNLAFYERTGDFITFDTQQNDYIVNSFNPYWLLDGKIFWQNRFLTLYIEASNLLDKEYIDSGSLAQPGRWIRGGIKVTLTD